jgi:hypothetical protein
MNSPARLILTFSAGAMLGLLAGVVTAVGWFHRRPAYVLTRDIVVGQPSVGASRSATFQGVVHAGSTFSSFGRKGDINFVQFPIVAITDSSLAGSATSVTPGELAPWETAPVGGVVRHPRQQGSSR